VLVFEVLRGIANDLYMIARGIEVPGYLIWVVIHSIVIVTGILALRSARTGHVVEADLVDHRPSG
jgi:hypothetical protein